MTIDAATGAINWTPTEAQGPSTNTIQVVVTDSNPAAATDQALTATTSLTDIVREVNTSPVIPPQEDRTVNELEPLSIAIAAQDSDLPAQRLSYTLAESPDGATINAEGVIKWTPSEAQGPSTNVFTTVVIDSGVPAHTATNSFTVVVNEVNAAPVLAPVSGQSVHYGFPVTAQAAATDADLPAQTLTYSLASAPASATIDASSGAISWTPSQDQLGSNPFTVVVTDNGSPALSATNTFTITVTGNESRLEIKRLPSGLMQVTTTAETGQDYELQISTDLVNWTPYRQFKLLNSPDIYIDPESETVPIRFYRLGLLQQ
jgi:hypothetical protein